MSIVLGMWMENMSKMAVGSYYNAGIYTNRPGYELNLLRM